MHLKIRSLPMGKATLQSTDHIDPFLATQFSPKVYAVDWSLDGQRVATGSKDRLLKIWRH